MNAARDRARPAGFKRPSENPTRANGLAQASSFPLRRLPARSRSVSQAPTASTYDEVMGVACVFCAIARSESSAHVVLDDDACIAFLDVKPLFHGHVLLIPRVHVVTLPELPADDVAPFFTRVRSLASAVPKALGAEGSFVAMNNIVSQSVPHLHVHIVPRKKGDGLKGFFWPRTKYASDAAMADTAAAIRSALATAAHEPRTA
jgi:histidine triad (HIT) family protein